MSNSRRLSSAGKARGRLVEDQQVGLVGERPGDGDQLPVGGAQIAEIPVERQVKPTASSIALAPARRTLARETKNGVPRSAKRRAAGLGNRQTCRADLVGRLVHGRDAGLGRFGRASSERRAGRSG